MYTFALFLLFGLALEIKTQTTSPEQVHLSYGVDPTQMLVTWSSMAPYTVNPVCNYGVSKQSLTMKAYGTNKKFVDGGKGKHTQYIHRVALIKLQPGTMYNYQCGDGKSMTKIFNFTAMRDDADWGPQIAMYGDLGLKNGQSVKRLKDDTQKGMYDAIFHIGDFAYDLDTQNASYGDEFLREMESLAAQLPYMTCPGNHEYQYNFSNYKNRFTMPTDEYGDRMFYSFNMGPAHIISLSTEYYFFIYYGIMQPVHQYNWLEKDLQEANKPENRAKRPWIITMGHRPMYCSNKDHDDCTRHESLVRIGIPLIHAYGLEKLFYDYGVDLALWAHEHSYERLWPIYDRQVYNGSLAEPYTNPKAPVHIITGSAGCQENHDDFKNNTASWSAFRSNDYGYTRMHIMNKTHLYLEQVSDDKGGKIIDSITLRKDHHGSYLKKETQPKNTKHKETLADILQNIL